MTENTEIFPVAKLANAVLIESISKVQAMVLHTDDIDPAEVKSFLRLQKRIEKFAGVKVALLTADESMYMKCLTKGDTAIDISRSTPQETVARIRKMIASRNS